MLNSAKAFGCYDWQLNPFSPGGFNDFAASAAWGILALLLENHSHLV